MTMLIDEARLLERARAGDEGAFAALVEPRRRELQAHCYRMLGSVHDAEDALQDALLRAWRGVGGVKAGSGSIRPWLYKIATNTCLDEIAKRPKRELPVDHGPAADPNDGPGQPLLESVWVEPYPDGPDARYEERETVELAFIAALQHLPATQRAILILREVLGYSAKETADVLETTPAGVNSGLQRARAAVDSRVPEESQQATLRALGDDGVREIVERYMDAWERGDVDAVVSMLADDAILTMPPMATWYSGIPAVRVFLEKFAFAQTWDGSRFTEGTREVRLVPVRASGQIAFGAYKLDDSTGTYRPYTLQVLFLRGDRIQEIAGFVTPELFRHFDLPAEIPA
jgi:RNA polymerase sigma-70 factor (ECF subfamily)